MRTPSEEGPNASSNTLNETVAAWELGLVLTDDDHTMFSDIVSALLS